MDFQKNTSKEQLQLLLSPRDAANALGICEKTLWTYTKNGQIPSMKIGSSVKYPIASLEAWIEKQSQKSA